MSQLTLDTASAASERPRVACPLATAKVVKGGETFTAPKPGIMVFFPSPDTWGTNSEGEPTLFGQYAALDESGRRTSALLLEGGKQATAGGEKLFGSLNIYRKVAKAKTGSNGNGAGK